MDLTLSAKGEGQGQLWYIHCTDGTAVCEVTDEDGKWLFSQEGSIDEDHLRMRGKTITGTAITIDVKHAGDGYQGTISQEKDGKRSVKDIVFHLYKPAHACKGHKLNFSIIRSIYLSSQQPDEHAIPSVYASFDLDGDHTEETLWVRNSPRMPGGAFFLFDPHSGHTEYLTKEGSGVSTSIQGNVINTIEEINDGYSRQTFFVVAHNRITRRIEIIRQYNGMTGQMDTSYKDIESGQPLTEQEYNAFAATLVTKDITLQPDWQPFPSN